MRTPCRSGIVLAGLSGLLLCVLGAPGCCGDDIQALTAQWKAARNLGVPVRITCDVGEGVVMEVVLVPAGEFMMGSPDSEKGRDTNEGPQRRVTISKPFYMGVTEVTQAQWKALMSTEPWDRSGVKIGAGHSASYIIPSDIRGFCEVLSAKTGRTVRLPTEAEWEYACRAGTTTAYSFGDDPSKLGDYAWYRYNTRGGVIGQEQYAHSVGVKKPNPWGLYDMHGNVWEWCSDEYAVSYADADVRAPKEAWLEGERVIRGGSMVSVPGDCRSASRFRADRALPNWDTGFRVVIPVEREEDPIEQSESRYKPGGGGGGE